MQDSPAKQAGGEGLPGFGPDTIEAAMRERVRETIEAIVHEELEAALGARDSICGQSHTCGSDCGVA